MAVPNPATDPLWAYNTLAWTNQNDGSAGTLTKNVEGAALTGAAMTNNSFLSEPEALSGFIARSLDPAVNSVSGNTGTALSANTTTYVAAIQVVDPALTSKVVISAKYTTTADTFAFGLYNFAGAQIATVTGVACTTSFAPVVGTWSTATVLSPGTYYIALTPSSTHTTLQTTTLTVENALLPQATTFAANVLNWRFFSATVTAGTVPSSLSGTVAGTTTGWFAGLA